MTMEQVDFEAFLTEAKELSAKLSSQLEQTRKFFAETEDFCDNLRETYEKFENTGAEIRYEIKDEDVFEELIDTLEEASDTAEELSERLDEIHDELENLHDDYDELSRDLDGTSPKKDGFIRFKIERYETETRDSDD